MSTRTRNGTKLRAFTLVEVLTTVIILSLLAGTFGLARSAFENDSGLPRQEALRLAHWLTNFMTISNRSGRPFSLICPGNVAESFILAEWQNPLQTETYTSLYGCKFIRYQGTAPKSLYSPQWNSLVPTITIKVSRGLAEHFVVISQHGRVRTTPKP
ncbi:MAG: type II secretion system GspH family protein [Synergistaceae bacterium]|jgi:prepilin-type N-terminal cleavage/methylation domain-containing protein|nr:type II secretion system GspH family protein [Synergistaceae bacterium]